MRYKKGAKALYALGATLVVFSSPSIAAVSKSSIAGIEAANTAGISAGSIAGISAGNVFGISAGNIAGISAGNVFGISAGNIAGISAGNVAGISAGSIAGISAGNVAGISAGSIAGISAGNVLISGPVDSIDHVNGAFESMGQIVLASQGMLSGMQVGDYVSVEGTAISSGWYYADNVSISDERYVPGSTEVFISGMISSINTMEGTAQMGDLIIDYTPSLGSSVVPSGEAWSFIGTQPLIGGAMISNRSEGIR